ncbi:MAG: hypothetical protein AAFP92_16900 [Bacteroidota bacterium]
MLLKYSHLFVVLLILMPKLWAQEEDCRLKKETLKPLIQRFNPYFAHHKWNPKNRLEMARIGSDRVVIITQDGCKRHYTKFNLLLDPEAIVGTDSFWIAEVKSFMHKIYFGTQAYEPFQHAFEAAFIEKFRMHGINRRFNFPLGTRNFICEVRSDPTKGGRIIIEMVTFIFREKVQTRRTGIAQEQDDGWVRQQQP